MTWDLHEEESAKEMTYWSMTVQIELKPQKDLLIQHFYDPAIDPVLGCFHWKHPFAIVFLSSNFGLN
jgi:hypothetical protein